MLLLKLMFILRYSNSLIYPNRNCFINNIKVTNNRFNWNNMAEVTNLRQWNHPQKDNKLITGLYVKNSLFPQKKVEFVPEEGRKIKWYSCGPTVYDVSHLGHARNYIVCDTIRSILENYFNYDVFFVVNVTDVDDKIIRRALDEGKSISEVSKHWEEEFWKDMLSLGISLPDSITRVSEYIDEIIKYIEKIISNGYAYESDGSVYFDIDAYTSSGKHVYAKLEPTSFNDYNRILDGEGALTEVSVKKRSKCDFALWKKSKENEPSWDSPWGPGRPGWHIECSAMSSNMFGDGIIDIHSGGVDLRFPHHDNEIAQSEAHSDSNRWVNYFLHFGHLHIHGLKMSKSLKNFISIKELLRKYNKRQIRLLFLTSKYDSTLNFNPEPEGMDQSVSIDESFFNFFALLNSRLEPMTSNQKWTEEEFSLFGHFNNLKDTIHVALLDNFDTPKVISSISKFIGVINAYLSDTKICLKKSQGLAFKEYLYRILSILKLVEPGCEYGTDGKIEKSIDKPLLESLAELRKKTRAFAKSVLKNNDTIVSESKDILKHCDELRDSHLTELGIILEDYDNGDYIIKYKSVKDQECEKFRKSDRKPATNGNKLNKALIPPEEYIHAMYPNKFGKLDELYLPIEYADGTLVSKSERKSLEKIMERHRKKYSNSG